MKPVHYITIAAFIGLTAILYWGINTVPPKKEGTAGIANAGPGHEAGTFNPDSLFNVIRLTLPEHAQETVLSAEKQLTALTDSGQMAPLMQKLADTWLEHQGFIPAAYYHYHAGRLENSEKKLNFAAQLFLDLARKATSTSLQAWEGQLAIAGFSQALALNPGNDTTRIHLAECYIGTGETMQGVLMLREVTDREPENIPANLILGQQGIVSGQLDKAAERFETVLRQEPRNLEGLLGLAEVYKNKGNKAKAIELLETAKNIMNHPGFSKDIDEYIQSFK